MKIDFADEKILPEIAIQKNVFLNGISLFFFVFS